MTVVECVRLPPSPSSARVARDRVASVLAGGTTTGIAVLLVSELATNAILHAGSDFEVIIYADDDRLRIEVTDANTQLPTLRNYVAESISGRGLHMVATAADRWGFEATATGKVVWFELAL